MSPEYLEGRRERDFEKLPLFFLHPSRSHFISAR